MGLGLGRFGFSFLLSGFRVWGLRFLVRLVFTMAAWVSGLISLNR